LFLEGGMQKGQNVLIHAVSLLSTSGVELMARARPVSESLPFSLLVSTRRREWCGLCLIVSICRRRQEGLHDLRNG
jgi:hypothetical protein